MKKMRLLLLSALVGGSSMAQNLDLNTWGAEDDPTGWSAPVNAFTMIVGDTSVVRATGSVGYGARLNPVDLSALGAPIYASFLSLGADGNGIPQAIRLDSVYFDAKLDNAGVITNQAGVQVVLTKFNGSTVDTIGTGEYIFSGDVASYTNYGIEITYDPTFDGIQPDSVKISIFVGSDDANAVNSSLWIDQFEFVEIDYTGLTVLNSNEIILYPTIVSNEVKIDFGTEEVERVVILDLSGRLVANVSTAEMNELNWNTHALQNGTYLVNVMADEFTLLKQTKFVVQH